MRRTAVFDKQERPFHVGLDGLADKDEPGYDPVTNPDPNGDDYHYLFNPTGTRNWTLAFAKNIGQDAPSTLLLSIWSVKSLSK